MSTFLLVLAIHERNIRFPYINVVKTNLAPPLFIEVTVQGKWSVMSLCGIDFDPFYDFWTVPIELYFLVFYFIIINMFEKSMFASKYRRISIVDIYPHSQPVYLYRDYLS